MLLRNYGRFYPPALAQWKFPRHRMERLEGRRLARQRHFLFPLLRPVVRDREKETGGGADGLLVAKPGRVVPAALLCPVLQKRFRVHLCVRVHLDSLHSEPDHPAAAQGGPSGLFRLRNGFAASGQLLRQMRHETGPVAPRTILPSIASGSRSICLSCRLPAATPALTVKPARPRI